MTKYEFLQADGFGIIRNVFEGQAVERFRESLDQLVHKHRKGELKAEDPYMVHNPFLYEEEFLDAICNHEIVAAVDSALGATSILYAYTTSSMPPTGRNYSSRVHVDSPRVIPSYPTNLGVIVALDDFRDENGATYFLPNSFEMQESPTDEEFFEHAVRVYPKRGDIVVFNARTWHFGGFNKTDDVRHALTMNFCRSFMRQRFDYPRLLQAAGITEPTDRTLRRLLGYNVRMPSTMEEYFLPEEERLYLPNQG